MRRAQIDAGSQPVRNYCTTPSFTSGAVATIRENRVINPGFEISSNSLTVRTNLATRPRMIDTSLGGYGSQTLTAVTGLSGVPEGITTAVRVAYTAGAGNPGAMILLGPAVSTQYSLTAWVYNEGAAAESIAFALQGVTSGGSQGVPPGVWTRLEWVMTSSSSASPGFGVRIGSPTATGSFLITGVTVETNATIAPSFFDGATAAAGDFTYSWVGGAGTSTSLQRAPNVQYWAASSTATIWQTATAPHAGSLRCVAVQTKGGNGDGLYVSDTAVVAGTPYTMSAWIKVTTAIPNMSIAMRFKDSGGGTLADINTDGSVGLSIGNWVRITGTGTAPTGAANLQPMIRVYATHTATLFYVDNVMVETGEAAQPYFDGSYATAGELTHSWNGAAHHSTSLERAPAATGLVTSGSALRASWMSVDRQRSSQPFARTLIKSNFAIGLNIEDGVFPANVARRTDSIWFRTSRATSVTLRYRRPSTGTVYAAQTAVAIPANKWTELRYTTNGFGDPDVCAGLLIDVTMVIPGDYYDIAEHMTVAGTYTGDYIDGGTPFGKWEGTPLASTSIAYPPQFLDIAGKPDVDILGAGQNSANPVTVDAFTARTFYVVYETDGYTLNYNTCFTYGIGGSKGFLLQTAAAGSASLANRVDFVGGTSNGAIVMGSGRLARRHVAAFTFEQGLAISRSCLNGNTDIVSGWTPSTTGWDNGRLVTSVSTEIRNVRGLVFYADHDRATRVAISRYLGNKYGAAVA